MNILNTTKRFVCLAQIEDKFGNSATTIDEIFAAERLF